MKKSNISIFIPHLGCPNQCSFCDQKTITSKVTAPTVEDVKNTVKTALNSGSCSSDSTEIAFFGGSFTAINRDYMLSLLQTANQFIQSGSIAGIRISTRPDCIDDEILTLLKKYGVTSIELGAQSMDDGVLLANHRGHTANDVVIASNLIKDYGFSLGLQMMTGLYTDSPDKVFETAQKIAELNPDTVRIYPAITLRNTHLASLYQKGEFIPEKLEDSVELCAKLLDFFMKKDIKVIKLGLHASEEVEANYVAGPYHPSFRELCESRLYLNKAIELLQNTDKSKNVTLIVNNKCISKMTGNQKNNIKALKEMGFVCTVKGDALISPYSIKIEIGE